jgi:hypothetical protein
MVDLLLLVLHKHFKLIHSHLVLLLLIFPIGHFFNQSRLVSGALALDGREVRFEIVV